MTWDSRINWTWITLTLLQGTGIMFIFIFIYIVGSIVFHPSRLEVEWPMKMFAYVVIVGFFLALLCLALTLFRAIIGANGTIIDISRGLVVRWRRDMFFRKKKEEIALQAFQTVKIAPISIGRHWGCWNGYAIVLCGPVKEIQLEIFEQHDEALVFANKLGKRIGFSTFDSVESVKSLP